LASFVGEEGEENEEKKMGGDREAWRRKWADMDGVYQERGAKPPPHEMQPVGEKTDRIGCTTLQHPVHRKSELQNYSVRMH